MTEAEIRQAIEDQLQRIYGGRRFSIDNTPMYNVLAPLVDSEHATSNGWGENFFPAPDHPGTLWADMRQSEADELAAALDAILIEEEGTFAKRVIDRAVAAGTLFAMAHPDIPRGRWPLLRADTATRVAREKAPA